MIALVGAQQAGMDFGELVLRHQSMVYSLAWRFLRDRGLAEEVAQEVFFSLHRNLSRIESPAHAISWLRKVTAQRAIDEGRKRMRRPGVSLEVVREPAAGGPVRDVMLEETLRRLVATLPEAPRMVMILRYQEDLDPTEIAEALSMPLSTVKRNDRSA